MRRDARLAKLRLEARGEFGAVLDEREVAFFRRRVRNSSSVKTPVAGPSSSTGPVEGPMSRVMSSASAEDDGATALTARGSAAKDLAKSMRRLANSESLCRGYDRGG